MKPVKSRKVISITTALPGTVALFADDGGGPDAEDPVLAWGLVEVTEPDGFKYERAVPMVWQCDIMSMDDVTENVNFIGVRWPGMPEGYEAAIKETRESYMRQYGRGHE